MVTGSISGMGSNYVITLRAVTAETGDVIARGQVEAGSREQVLETLGEAAIRLRAELGESLSSIEQFDVPLVQATTSNLQALKAYSLAIELNQTGRFSEAISQWENAVNFDPNFAVAHAVLGTVYAVLRQVERSISHAKKAFELRDRVSQREKYGISTIYYRAVTGELEKAIKEAGLWKQTYPRDYTVHQWLSRTYNDLGRYEEAIDEAREAIRLNPRDPSSIDNLADSFKRLNRYADAKEIIDQAMAQGLDSGSFHYCLYEIGFINNDPALMQEQIDWHKGDPFEFFIIAAQARSLAFSGQLGKAREILGRAIEMVQRHNINENVALFSAWNAYWAACFGNCQQVPEVSLAALEVSRDWQTLVAVASALSLCGEIDQAESLIDEVAGQYPKHTMIKGLWLPTIKATIEIERSNPTAAIQLLQPVIHYEEAPDLAGFRAKYFRGQAYLQLGDGTKAAAEFQKILDRRGQVPLSPLYPLAHLGLAQAANLEGDIAKSKKAYQDFFALWKDAEPDIPILIEAKQEYAELLKSESR